MKTVLGVTIPVLCAFMVSGCFTPATMAVLQGPQNYAKSPNFDLSRTWRIAVLPPTTGTSPGSAPEQGLYDYAGIVLMRTGKFQVVDRTQVDALLDEQQFSYSGVVDAGTAARLGKMLGAEAVMTTRINSLKHDDFFEDEPDYREAVVTTRIISVETAEVLYSAEGQGSDFEGALGALKMALETALYSLGR